MGSIYKIITKMLAVRMRGVVDKLVYINQTSFVPGRSMMDGVLLVNEILDWAKKKKKGCLLLKVDFENAYDSISWNYLRWIMVRMGFGKRWLKWMESCIFNNHMSVLVNGSATKEFKVQRGLRQGDPISPFLFVLAMEGLTALTKKAVEVGEFKPFKYGANDFVDILQFADDTIILGEPSYDNLWSLKVLLRSFELVSGLKINF
ncbi:secreted RxLR effector protein 78-like [Vicia villosa]|uniref:secreted RxLR effector protein 78-like n=1 Tax=Vicia villosa TaxID=3911 RepID=UPI00273BF72C|nr:secreted RxLR effector protein 78-like [Vicia villosa]